MNLAESVEKKIALTTALVNVGSTPLAYILGIIIPTSVFLSSFRPKFVHVRKLSELHVALC